MSMHVVRGRLNGAVTPGMVSALDIGCGPGTYLHSLPNWITVRYAIDAAPQELAKVTGAITMLGAAQDLLPTFTDRSIDLVYALDFVEHLHKPEGRSVLLEAQRIADDLVIVFTPFGFHVQDHGRDHPQTHRSGWWPKDFTELGFAVEVLDFDYGHGHKEPAIWAQWRRS